MLDAERQGNVFPSFVGSDLSTKSSSQIEFILKHTQQLAKLGFWNLDRATGNMLWSDEMYNLHGVNNSFNPNHALALLMFYEKPCRHYFIKAAKLLYEKAIPFDITARLVTPLKYVKWVRVVGHPVLEEGKVTGIMGISLDVTRMKEAEELLQASEGKFSKAFRHNPNAMIITREEDMMVVDVNAKLFPLLGYTRDELLGERLSHLDLFVHPEQGSMFLDRYYANGIAESECEWKRKNGDIVHVLVHSSRIEINGKNYFLSFIKDNAPKRVYRQDPQPTSGRNEPVNEFLEKSQLDPVLKMAIPTLDGLVFLRLQEIIYCEAQSNYTCFYLTGGQKFLASRTLKEFESMLPDGFFRIHNSYIVNLDLIKTYNKRDGTVTMESGAVVGISKGKKDKFLQRIGC